MKIAKTHYGASILKRTCYDFIRRCRDAHPEDKAPAPKPVIASMKLIGVDDKIHPVFGRPRKKPQASPKQDSQPAFAPEDDDEIPF